MQELKTGGHTHADISKLPPELLVSIFLLVQANSPLKDWHRITHVCAYWRDTALGSPILWTKPPAHNQNYTHLMLERSKTANLDIVLARSVSTATITSISSHIGRIQVLKMDLSADQLNDVWNHFSTSGQIFSQLKSLDIDRPINDFRSFSVDLLLPSAVFQLPSSLDTIHLRAVTIDWKMIAPLNLTSLCLGDVGITDKISIQTLLDTLRQMPRLRDLALPLTTLLPNDVPTIQATKVALPCLHSLYMTDNNPRHIMFLLSHFTLPMLNSLKTYSLQGHGHESYSFDDLTTIVTTIANGKFPVGGSLHIEPGYISNAIINKIFFATSLPRVRDENDIIRSTQQLLTQIAPLFPGLVQVTFAIPLDSEQMVQIFGSMRQLQAITIYESRALLSALTSALVHVSPDGTRTFPGLDTVGCNDVYWGAVPRRVVIDFCNALLQRSYRGRGTAIKTVYCFDTPLPRWAVELLKDGEIWVVKGDLPIEYGF